MKRSSEIDPKVVYKVIAIKKVKTKYGESLLVETEDFVFFLPGRFIAHMSDDDIQKINTSLTPVGVRALNSVDVGKQSPAYNFEFVNI